MSTLTAIAPWLRCSACGAPKTHSELDAIATRLDAAEDAKARLREALDAIAIRAEQGDPKHNWLPDIARMARAALASTEEPGFRIRFICCGLDDGSAVRRTWQEADELRKSYISVQGHDRTAIIETLASTEEPRKEVMQP